MQAGYEKIVGIEIHASDFVPRVNACSNIDSQLNNYNGICITS